MAIMIRVQCGSTRLESFNGGARGSRAAVTPVDSHGCRPATVYRGHPVDLEVAAGRAHDRAGGAAMEEARFCQRSAPIVLRSA